MSPRAVLIAGPNGAGKTTFAREYLPLEPDRPRFLNADLIAAGLSPFDPDRAALRAGRLLLAFAPPPRSPTSCHREEPKATWRSPSAERPRSRSRRRLHSGRGDRHVGPAGLLAMTAHLEGLLAPPPCSPHRCFEAGWRNFTRVYQPRFDEWLLYDNQARAPLLLRRSLP